MFWSGGSGDSSDDSWDVLRDARASGLTALKEMAVAASAIIKIQPGRRECADSLRLV